MKRISIDDLTGFADICECERLLGELVAGCSDPYAPINKDLTNEWKKLEEEINPPDSPGGNNYGGSQGNGGK